MVGLHIVYTSRNLVWPPSRGLPHHILAVTQISVAFLIVMCLICKSIYLLFCYRRDIKMIGKCKGSCPFGFVYNITLGCATHENVFVDINDPLWYPCEEAANC